MRQANLTKSWWFADFEQLQLSRGRDMRRLKDKALKWKVVLVQKRGYNCDKTKMPTCSL